MQQIIYFLVRFKIFWLFLIFEIISLTLVFNSSPYHNSKYFNTANNFTGGIYTTTSGIKQYFHLTRINDSLVAENARLHSEFYKLSMASHKNDTLAVKDTIPVKDTFEIYVGRYVYIPAEVISNSTSNRNNYLMLNVGSADGVTRQSGVVCNEGVVGIVYEVSEHFCTVISLLNSNAKISSKIDSSNSSGTLMWNGKSPLYAQIDDINKHVKVAAGMTISTSGLNYIFPRNVKLGTVESFEVVGNTNSIKVKLATPFETLFKVYVVKNLDLEEQLKLLSKIKEK